MIRPLTGRGRFEAVRRDGRTVSDGEIRIRFRLDGGDQVRVAYAISSRGSTAVGRNRLRRRLRAALADLDRRDAIPSGDYVVSAVRRTAEIPFPDLIGRILKLLEKIR
ncbi:MAG: ribonuclease P protein component [Microthrixaceae bacterium]